jgi:hypothetical protein
VQLLPTAPDLAGAYNEQEALKFVKWNGEGGYQGELLGGGGALKGKRLYSWGERWEEGD